MPSASPPRFDFAGCFKVFIPQARWFIIIGTLYNSLFLQSALQSFFSPYRVPYLLSPATVIGFGGGGTSFPREKKMPFLVWGTFLRFYLCFFFAFLLLISSPAASCRLLFLRSCSDLHSSPPPPAASRYPQSHIALFLVQHGQLDRSLTSGLQVVKKQLDVCSWEVSLPLRHSRCYPPCGAEHGTALEMTAPWFGDLRDQSSTCSSIYWGLKLAASSSPLIPGHC